MSEVQGNGCSGAAKRPGEAMRAFLWGAACFFVSQGLLRLPLLQWMGRQVFFLTWQIQQPLLVVGLIALSAGVFEEAARLLFRRFLVRPRPGASTQAMWFGLGHGVMEIWILILLAGALPLSPWGWLERCSAVAVHVGLTTLIWQSDRTGRWRHGLLLAIFLHGLIDFFPGVLLQNGASIVLVELLLLLLGAVGAAYAVRKAKRWSDREHIE